LIFGVFGGKVTLGCIFLLCFDFAGELNLPKVLEPSEGCCFFRGYTWLHIILCFNFWVWGWFGDCRAIARNDGFFFRLHLVAYFYFVLIFGFGCGLSFGYAQDDIVVLEMDKIGDFRFLTGFFALL